MNYIELPKEACFTPLYSPRTTLSRTHAEMERLTTNLAISIDKYILGFFKDAFQLNGQYLSLQEFISQGLKHLTSWQRQLKNRNQKIHLCLQRLFDSADSNGSGTISWNQFNSMLIQKGLNLKSLRDPEAGNATLMKPLILHQALAKHNAPIQKMVNVGNKIALFSEQSNEVKFYNIDGSPCGLKPLVLSQQELTVQTSVSKRTKAGRKQILKKDLVVAEYRNILLDMIYIEDSKYSMLITSSTDSTVRGWDLSGNIPCLAKQPENQDQKMQHQFPSEIHTMAWDHLNEILYCAGKSPTIYEWMVKTDSERELCDSDGHSEMISAMIMMPKLQFLATGGYDGKLILWDTISQSKKFKYKEHTRSISSMAFHEGLILLFTSAYDHSICVWNPYIQSLIHKIVGNSNFIQLDIISGTQLLLALDADSNVHIREVNKFALVSSFSVDKHQHRIQPTCLTSNTSPLRYYFGGSAVAAYQYLQVDAHVIQESSILGLHYDPSCFTLYTPVKNHLVAWDLLTGTVSNTLRCQSPAEISAFGIMRCTKMSVVGDLDGNLLLRKLQNGVLVKKLHKHKLVVSLIVVEELQHHKMIFSGSYDGQVGIFDRDGHGDYNLHRSLHLRTLSPQSLLTSLCYQYKRHTLVMGTNAGEVLFVDIDKNKLISRCDTSAGDIQNFVYFDQENLILAFSKKAEIFGIYLPPHVKKFKASCHLLSEQTHTKITSVAMSATTKRCNIGFENGDVLCFWLSQEIIADSAFQEESHSLIHHSWKHSFGQTVRDLQLLQQEDVLVALTGSNTISIINCQNGEIIAKLTERQPLSDPPPILHLDEETDSVYIRSQDISVPIKTASKEEEIRRLFDPTYYLTLVQPYEDKLMTTSNPSWKFYPNIYRSTQATISNATKLLTSIEQYQKQAKTIKLVKTQSQPSFSLHRITQIQKKLERHKEEEDPARLSKMHSLHNASAASLRPHASNVQPRQQKYSTYKSSQQTQKMSLQSSNPLYRLGMALHNLDLRDPKAIKLMQMGQQQLIKSKGLKLPSIPAAKRPH